MNTRKTILTIDKVYNSCKKEKHESVKIDVTKFFDNKTYRNSDKNFKIKFNDILVDMFNEDPMILSVWFEDNVGLIEQKISMLRYNFENFTFHFSIDEFREGDSMETFIMEKLYIFNIVPLNGISVSEELLNNLTNINKNYRINTSNDVIKIIGVHTYTEVCAILKVLLEYEKNFKRS